MLFQDDSPIHSDAEESDNEKADSKSADGEAKGGEKDVSRSNEAKHTKSSSDKV